MEISSRTIISWFFHLHGNVRANASNISCASSVTFSPMLSVCVVVVKERERERERGVSGYKKTRSREWHITERLDVPNEQRNNTLKQHVPFCDGAGCALVHDRARRNAKERETTTIERHRNPKTSELHSYPRQTAPLSPRFQTVSLAFLYR